MLMFAERAIIRWCNCK